MAAVTARHQIYANDWLGINREPPLMTPTETRFFELVDHYARTRHACFLAEMNFRTKELGYDLCFRPTGTSENPTGRYAHKYLRIATELVEAAAHREQLEPFLASELDTELSKLRVRGDSLRES